MRLIKMSRQDNTETKESLFNAGIAKLKRIDKVKMAMHEARSSNNFVSWFNCLCSWREEMCERFDDAELAKSKLMEKNIEVFLGTQHTGIVKGYLNDYAIDLSRLEYKYKYSMPDKEDDEGL